MSSNSSLNACFSAPFVFPSSVSCSTIPFIALFWEVSERKERERKEKKKRKRKRRGKKRQRKKKRFFFLTWKKQEFCQVVEFFGSIYGVFLRILSLSVEKKGYFIIIVVVVILILLFLYRYQTCTICRL